MIATYVEPAVTPLSFHDAQEALRWAMGSPSLEQLALCLAKSALETGRWQKIWNYNFGNVKAGEKYVGMFTCIRLNEVIDGKVKWFDPDSGGAAVPPGHPQTRMRAFANAWDGAEQYLGVMRGRFGLAYDAMMTGDPVKYVRTLKATGYFTADEAPYLKGVQSLYREFVAKLQGIPREESPLDDSAKRQAEAILGKWLHEQTGDPDDETRSA